MKLLRRWMASRTFPGSSMVERFAVNEEVGGSSPSQGFLESCSLNFYLAGVAQGKSDGSGCLPTIYWEDDSEA